MLKAVTVNFKDQLTAILSCKNPLNVVNKVLSNPNRLVELISDCSVTVIRQTLKLDKDMVSDVEQLSRKMCYSRHHKTLRDPGPYPKDVSKGAKIRNRYNQVPHLTQDTNRK